MPSICRVGTVVGGGGLLPVPDGAWVVVGFDAPQLDGLFVKLVAVVPTVDLGALPTDSEVEVGVEGGAACTTVGAGSGAGSEFEDELGELFEGAADVDAVVLDGGCQMGSAGADCGHTAGLGFSDVGAGGGSVGGEPGSTATAARSPTMPTTDAPPIPVCRRLMFT